MTRYYHVIRKQGLWHLYAGNAIASLMAEQEQSIVLRAARALARHDGARVVVHKATASDLDAGGASQPENRNRLGDRPRPASVKHLRPA